MSSDGERLPPRLGVVYVQYAARPAAEPLTTLRRYLDRLWYCRPFLVVVDNFRAGLAATPIHDGLLVGGDNVDREFSGWDLGLRVLRTHVPDVEMVLLVNDVFLAPGPSFLEDRPSLDDLERWRDAHVAVGRIDRYAASVTLDGRPLDGWLCTNAVLLPRPVLDALGSLVTWRERDLDRVVPRPWPRGLAAEARVSFAGREVRRRTCALEVDGRAPLLLTLDAAGPVPAAGVTVGGCTLDEATALRGWTRDDTGPWTAAPVAGATFAACHAGATAQLEMHRPAWAEAVDRPRHVRVRLLADPFLRDAPLDGRYRAALLDWLCVGWRHRLVLGPDTWPAFRGKLRAILNEASLSQRLQALGIALTAHGPERYY